MRFELPFKSSNTLSLVKPFLKFFWQSTTKHRIENTFVKTLIEEVIEDDRKYYDFGALLFLRAQLERNQTNLNITDLGAGSRVQNSNTRTVSSIVKSAVSPQWQCELLFRLVHFLQPKNRLELGTSLGLSSLYQYLPIKQAPFFTLEGCPNIASVAQQNFKKFKANNIQLTVGNFKDTLPKVLEQIGRLDYAFIDGNHQKAPTLDYFEQCLAYSHADTILVFDDIHWSEEMQAAWRQLKQHPQVGLSIDLFFMGIIGIKKNPQQTAEHFNIVPSNFKPWEKLSN